MPDDALRALTKLTTAGVSVLTALAIWPLIPRAATIPSVSKLQDAVRSFEAEARRRRSAEELRLDAEVNLAPDDAPAVNPAHCAGHSFLLIEGVES